MKNQIVRAVVAYAGRTPAVTGRPDGSSLPRSGWVAQLGGGLLGVVVFDVVGVVGVGVGGGVGSPVGVSGGALVVMVTGFVVRLTWLASWWWGLFGVVGDGLLGAVAVDDGFMVGVGGEHGQDREGVNSSGVASGGLPDFVDRVVGE